MVYDQNEVDILISWAAQQGVDISRLTFEVGPSDDVLPRLEPTELDLTFIDGSHAFPAAIVDWSMPPAACATEDLRHGRHPAPDGALGLFEFFAKDPRWELIARHRQVGRARARRLGSAARGVDRAASSVTRAARRSESEQRPAGRRHAVHPASRGEHGRAAVGGGAAVGSAAVDGARAAAHPVALGRVALVDHREQVDVGRLANPQRSMRAGIAAASSGAIRVASIASVMSSEPPIASA